MENQEIEEKVTKEDKKTKSTSFTEEKLKDFISKSAEVSKTAFSKAGTAVKKFSDKSVLKIQIQSVKSKQNKTYGEVGQLICELLSQKGADIENLSALSQNDENKQSLAKIKSLYKEVVKDDKEIKELEKQLKDK